MVQLGGLEREHPPLEHRHNDGTWSPLEAKASHHDPADHDPTDHDPERDWANGRFYVCMTCTEEIRVTELAAEGGPAKP